MCTPVHADAPSCTRAEGGQAGDVQGADSALCAAGTGLRRPAKMKTLILATIMTVASLLHLRRRPKPLPPTRHEKRLGILDTRG
jgi:hypothetical protein